MTASPGEAPAELLVRSPIDGAVLGSVKRTTPDGVTAAVARARAAQPAWAGLSTRERCRALAQFRRAVARAAAPLGEKLVLETGKPRQEALLHEVAVLTDAMAWIERNAPRALAPRRVRPHLLWHRVNRVHYRPRAVVAVISPYNFPLLIPFATAFAALASGAAVVLKPSELTPLVALLAKELWDRTGLPADLLQVLPGGPEVGQALIGARVEQVVFTGGTAAGRRVAAQAGEALVETVLELGGNAPLIARADADLELTARAVVFGGFINAGQACVAVERVYAHAELCGPLTARVAELVSALRVGDGRGSVDVGPLIDPRQLPRLEGLVADAVAGGAQVVVGGHREPGTGQFFAPTVLGNAAQEMAVVREEIFGPIVPIVRVPDHETALALANDSEPALTAYVFGRRGAAAAMARRIRAGSVVVNDVVSQYASPEIPFGGARGSGWGRVHGIEGLRAHAELSSLTTPRFRWLDSRAFWFPYGEGMHGWVQAFLRHWHGGGRRPGP